MAKRSYSSEEEEEESEADAETDAEREIEDNKDTGNSRKKLVIRFIVSGERRDNVEYNKSDSGCSNYLWCQADECGVDLSGAKTYNKRLKVCERHAKAPVVLVKGMRQRFCQQCSRFHEISQFDDMKRSCRDRLAGHNERRRKTQSGSVTGDGQRTSATKMNTAC